MSSNFSFKSRFKSFKYALQGISQVIRSEPNFRIHLIMGILVIGVGWLLNLTRDEWLFVSIAIALVLITEMFNTAIENLVDLNHPEQNKKAGLVKDIAAGAVLIASIIAAIIGAVIFLPKIL